MLSFVRCNMFEFSVTNSTDVNAGANMQSWRLYIRITIRVIQMTNVSKTPTITKILLLRLKKKKKKKKNVTTLLAAFNEQASNQNRKPATPPSPLPSTYYYYFLTLKYIHQTFYLPPKIVFISLPVSPLFF